MYKVVRIKTLIENIEKQLNNLEKKGWKLVCPYVDGDFLILHKK